MVKVSGGAFPSLVCGNGAGELQVLYEAGISSRRSIKSPVLANNEIVMATNFGWVLLQLKNRLIYDTVELCLWNPATQESINLPPYYKNKNIDYAVLTKPPSDPDCALLIWTRGYGPHSCTASLHYVNGDKIWNRENNLVEVGGDGGKEDTCDMMTFVPDSTESGEVFSGFVSKVEIVVPTKVVSIRFLECKPFPPLSMGPLGVGLRHRFYDECRGDMFAITVGLGGVRNKEISGVDVFKLDFHQMCWNIVDTCPNAAFFLKGRTQMVSMPTDSDDLGGRVYLAGYIDPSLLHVYHIREKTLMPVFLGCPPRTTYHWIFVESDRALDPVLKKHEILVLNNGDSLKDVPDLPVDVLRRISSCLTNPTDYLNLRAVSKLWTSVGTAKEWRTVLSSPSPSPFLMIPSSSDNGVSFMVDPYSGTKYNVINKDCSSRICYASHGWLLMYNEYSSEDFGRPIRVKLRLYNPLTKATTLLPECDRFDHFFFTCSPTSPDCVVFGVSVSRDTLILSEIYGQGKWSKWYKEDVKKQFPNVRLDQSNLNPFFIDETCFCFSMLFGGVAAMELADFGISFRQNYSLTRPCDSGSYEQNFLLAFGEKIASVYVGKELKWLKVFVSNEARTKWREVEDIDNVNIYLSKVSTVVVQGDSPGSGNRIYLPRFHQQHAVYYSMNTCKFHAGPEETEVTSYYDTKEQLHGCWFLPSFN